MRISIIGAGNIGGTLARRFRQLGHQVFIANSCGPDSLAALAEETGARPVTVRDAARSGEVVIVAIPENRVPELPEDLFAGVPDDVVVVDTGNYYPRQRDGRIEGIEEGLTESGWVAKRLGRPVVKTFNSMMAKSLMQRGRPKGNPERIALPVAGDDPRAKGIVMQLVEELGFDAVDAGRLDESWRQQPGSPVYTKDFDADRTRRALSDATPQRQPEWRATPHSPGNFVTPA
jgi:predicted dinucleotide-binding enzyme